MGSFRSEDGGEEEVKPVSSSSFSFLLRQDWRLQQTGSEHDDIHHGGDEESDHGDDEEGDHGGEEENSDTLT